MNNTILPYTDVNDMTPVNAAYAAFYKDKKQFKTSYFATTTFADGMPSFEMCHLY